MYGCWWMRCMSSALRADTPFVVSLSNHIAIPKQIFHALRARVTFLDLRPIHGAHPRCARAPVAVQFVPDELSGESNHCAAGAARTAKLARRAEGRMPGVKPFAPDTRRCDEAASVPCAPRKTRAGPQLGPSMALKHSDLAPAFSCGARLALRRKEQEKSSKAEGGLRFVNPPYLTYCCLLLTAVFATA